MCLACHVLSLSMDMRREKGYVTLEGAVSCTLDATDVSALDNMPERSNWHSIADTANPDHWAGKPSRSQLRQLLELQKAPTEELACRLRAAAQQTRERLAREGMLQTHSIEEEVLLLRAKHGCPWQSFVHGDRASEHAMQDGGFQRCHYSVMVALMQDTTLWIKPIGSQHLIEHTIRQGDAFCWRGDVAHAGTAHPGCESGHYRLFMHVDSIKRPINQKDRQSLFPIFVADAPGNVGV